MFDHDKLRCEMVIFMCGNLVSWVQHENLVRLRFNCGKDAEWSRCQNGVGARMAEMAIEKY